MTYAYIYDIENNPLGIGNFYGEPQRGDCFLIGDALVYVCQRRWSVVGYLELIVDYKDHTI